MQALLQQKPAYNDEKGFGSRARKTFPFLKGFVSCPPYHEERPGACKHSGLCCAAKPSSACDNRCGREMCTSDGGKQVKVNRDLYLCEMPGGKSDGSLMQEHIEPGVRRRLVAADHEHTIDLTAAQVAALEEGSGVKARTSPGPDGHTHVVELHETDTEEAEDHELGVVEHPPLGGPVDVVHCDGVAGPCQDHELHEDEELVWPEPPPTNAAAHEPEVSLAELLKRMQAQQAELAQLQSKVEAQEAELQKLQRG